MKAEWKKESPQISLDTQCNPLTATASATNPPAEKCAFYWVKLKFGQQFRQRNHPRLSRLLVLPVYTRWGLGMRADFSCCSTKTFQKVQFVHSRRNGLFNSSKSSSVSWLLLKGCRWCRERGRKRKRKDPDRILAGRNGFFRLSKCPQLWSILFEMPTKMITSSKTLVKTTASRSVSKIFTGDARGWRKVPLLPWTASWSSNCSIQHCQ